MQNAFFCNAALQLANKKFAAEIFGLYLLWSKPLRNIMAICWDWLHDFEYNNCVQFANYKLKKKKQFLYLTQPQRDLQEGTRRTSRNSRQFGDNSGTTFAIRYIETLFWEGQQILFTNVLNINYTFCLKLNLWTGNQCGL